jgi:hypothetical protein
VREEEERERKKVIDMRKFREKEKGKEYRRFKFNEHYSVCNPEKNIYCSDNKICDLTVLRNKCRDTSYVKQIMDTDPKLKEFEFKGHKMIGYNDTIDLLRKTLGVKKEGDNVLEPNENIKKDDEIIIEEDEEETEEEVDEEAEEEADEETDEEADEEADEEVEAISSTGIINPVSIKDTLEVLQDSKEEDINKIKLAQAQIIKCLGLTS